MTREEAIDILEKVKELDDSIYQYSTKYLEALGMAIKALKQTDVLDKIRAEIQNNNIFDFIEVQTALNIIDKYRKEQT